MLSRDGTLADAMSKAAFILGPVAGVALVDSFPDMSAVIAYQEARRLGRRCRVQAACRVLPIDAARLTKPRPTN